MSVYSDQSKEYLKQLLQIFRRITLLGGASGPDSINTTVASSALPSGAATAANQSLEITELQAIKTSVQIMDDWDSEDACKSVGITTIIKKTGANVGVSSAAYGAYDVIGDQSPIALPAGRILAGSGIIHSITVKDLTKQNSALKVVIFDSSPTGTTFTDNSPLDVADADIDKIIAWVDITASDYISFVDSSVAHVKGLSIPFKVSTDIDPTATDLYFCIISNGTPTYVADELSIAFGILQD